MSRPPRDLLERLGDHHDVSTFDSGNAVLDDWLRRHALAAQRMDSARTFVVTRSGRRVGYFSLTMGSVLRAEAPTKLVRGMPAYPVGMVLVARLAAVDQSEQGSGVGAAAGFVVSDAAAALWAWTWERHGFQAFAETAAPQLIR